MIMKDKNYYHVVKNEPKRLKKKHGYTEPVEPTHPYSVYYGGKPVCHIDKNIKYAKGMAEDIAEEFNKIGYPIL